LFDVVLQRAQGHHTILNKGSSKIWEYRQGHENIFNTVLIDLTLSAILFIQYHKYRTTNKE